MESSVNIWGIQISIFLAFVVVAVALEECNYF